MCNTQSTVYNTYMRSCSVLNSPPMVWSDEAMPAPFIFLLSHD